MAAAALSESTPAAIGMRTGVASSSSSALSPARSEPMSTVTFRPGSIVSSACGVGRRCHGVVVEVRRGAADRRRG